MYVSKNKALSSFDCIFFLQNQARKFNEDEVIGEDHRNTLPTNHDRRCERVKRQEEQTKRRREAAEAGLDHERVEQLDWTAEECDKWERKRKKKTPDVGFDSKYKNESHVRGRNFIDS